MKGPGSADRARGGGQGDSREGADDPTPGSAERGSAPGPSGDAGSAVRGSTGRPGPIRRRPGRSGGPRRLEESLGTLVNRWGSGADPGQVSSVFSRWEEIAGPVLADHVHPVRVDGDALVVAADHPAWATRARADAARILRAVGQLAGTAPTRLDVVVRRR